MTGKPRVTLLDLAHLPTGFTVFGAKDPWKEFQLLLPFCYCLVCYERALSTEGAGSECHFEGQRSTQRLLLVVVTRAKTW